MLRWRAATFKRFRDWSPREGYGRVVASSGLSAPLRSAALDMFGVGVRVSLAILLPRSLDSLAIFGETADARGADVVLGWNCRW